MTEPWVAELIASMKTEVANIEEAIHRGFMAEAADAALTLEELAAEFQIKANA